jgi:hypothetical protein
MCSEHRPVTGLRVLSVRSPLAGRCESFQPQSAADRGVLTCPHRGGEGSVRAGRSGDRKIEEEALPAVAE